MLAGAPLKLITQQTIREINANSSNEAGLIRLLLGSLEIVDAVSGLSTRQHTNYFVLGTSLFKGRTSEAVSRKLSDVGVSSRSVDRYLRSSIKQQSFYLDLLLEAGEYFSRTRKGQHLAAFVHLYRLLERVAFAFPVIYAGATHDYKKAYTALKSYLSDKSAGELKFFQVFQDSTIDAAFLDATLKFDMSAIPGDSKGSTVAVISRLIDPSSLVSGAGGVFEIKCGGVLHLFINVRNRFFHFGSDHVQNIGMSEIKDSDVFFGRLNNNFLNWIAFIYGQIIVRKCG